MPWLSVKSNSFLLGSNFFYKCFDMTQILEPIPIRTVSFVPNKLFQLLHGAENTNVKSIRLFAHLQDKWSLSTPFTLCPFMSLAANSFLEASSIQCFQRVYLVN